jgi:hypothetical protein
VKQAQKVLKKTLNDMPERTAWDRNRSTEEIEKAILKKLEETTDPEECTADAVSRNVSSTCGGSPKMKVIIAPIPKEPTEGRTAQRRGLSSCETVNALKDTGSTRTLISADFFRAMSGVQEYNVKPTDTLLRTAIAGEKSQQCEIVPMQITFQEKADGKSFAIEHDVIIVPSLSDSLIIGNDILSRYTLADMQDYLLMAKERIPMAQIYGMTGKELRDRCVKLPVFRVPSNITKKAFTAKKCTLIPGEVRMVPINIEGELTVADHWDHQAVELETDITAKMFKKGLRAQGGWQPYFKGLGIMMPIVNRSRLPLTVPKGLNVAKASLLGAEEEMRTRRIEVDIRQTTNILSEEKQTPGEQLQWHDPQEETTRRAVRYMLDKKGIVDYEERQRVEDELVANGYADPPLEVESEREVQEIGIEPEEVLDFDKEFSKIKFGEKARPFMKDFKDMLYRQKEIFQVGGRIEKTNAGEADPVFKPITKPIIQKQRPIPEQIKPEVDEVIRQLLKNGIIEKCTEPPVCLSNLHYTRKPTGELRLLVDLRLLNYYTKRIDYPASTIEENILKMGRARLVSSLDLASAFWSVGIKQWAKKYFAFLTPNNQVHCFASLPMGWSSSSFILLSILDRVFANIPDLINYLDDVLILEQTEDVPAHIEHLETTLAALRKAKFRIKAAKMEILPDVLDFLGVWYRINSTEGNSMMVPTTKLDAYMKAARPNRPMGVRSFLGSVGYYRKWCPRFAEIAYDLHKKSLLPNKSAFKWTTKDEEDYVRLLEQIRAHGVLLVPRCDRPFYSYSDASSIGICFLLFQKSDKGMLKLVNCTSKTFCQAHMAKHIYQKEFIALITGLLSNQFYLQYSRLILSFCDARGLSLTSLTKHHDPFLMRKALFLSMFPIKIFHIPGVLNRQADWLSRNPCGRRASDKSEIKGLSAKLAAKLIELVHFKPVVLSPHEVKTCLLRRLNQPGPFDEATSRKPPAVGRQLSGSLFQAQTRPGRKIKLPGTQRSVPQIPYLRNLLEDSGYLDKQRRLAFEEELHSKSEEDNDAWLTETFKIDPMTKDQEDSQDYYKWLDKPTGSPPPPPVLPPFQETYTRLTTIEEALESDQEEPSEDTATTISYPIARPTRPKRNAPKPARFREESTQREDSPMPPETQHTTPDQESQQPPLAREESPEATHLSNNDTTTLESDSGVVIDTNNPEDERPDVQEPHSVQPDQNENHIPCCEDNTQGKDCEHSLTNKTWKTLAAQPSHSLITLQQFRECQLKDPFCSDLIEKLSDKKQKDRQKMFYIKEGVLMYRYPKTEDRMVLPRSLLKHQVRVMHYTALGLHQSCYKITSTIRAEFYRPNLLEEIKELLRECAICPYIKRSLHQGEAHGTMPVITRPRSSYAIDWVSGFPKTKQGHTCVMLVVDAFSLLARYFPVTARTAEETIRVLKLVCQADATTISEIRSDQESCLKTDTWKDFCMENGIKHSHTAAGHPQGNSLPEQFAKKLKSAVRYLVHMLDTEWDQDLHLVTIANAKQVCILKDTPEKIHFGYTTTTPFTLMDKTPEKPLEELVQACHEKVMKVRQSLHDKRLKKQESKKDPKCMFKPGNVVMYAENPIKSQATVKLRNSGPYIIEPHQDPDSFSVWCKNLKSGQRRKLPMADLSPYKAAEILGEKPLTFESAL